MQEGKCKGMGLVSVNRSQKGEKGPRSSNSDHVKSSKMEVDLRRKSFCFGEIQFTINDRNTILKVAGTSFN